MVCSITKLTSTKFVQKMPKMAGIPIYDKKTFKNLLQNQKANDFGTWYVAFGVWAYQVCSNHDHRLNFTYLTANMFLKRLSFGGKECTEELKLECASFLDQTS